jgi:putative transcriptional regulator
MSWNPERQTIGSLGRAAGEEFESEWGLTMNERAFVDPMQCVRDVEPRLRGLRGLRGKGVPVEAPDVKALRESASVSKAEFARLIGVSRRTLENWEQKRTVPSGPARALLKIMATDPKAAVAALHA